MRNPRFGFLIFGWFPSAFVGFAQPAHGQVAPPQDRSSAERLRASLESVVARWEADRRNDEPGAYAVDTGRGTDPRGLVAKDEFGAGRLVYSASRRSGPGSEWATRIAWDRDTSGAFAADWIRLITPEAMVDYGCEERVVSVLSGPQLRVVEGLGETLGIGGAATLGGATLLDVFRHAELTQGSDSSGAWVEAGWNGGAAGKDAKPNRLRTWVPEDQWRPTRYEYRFGDAWIRFDLDWVGTAPANGASASPAGAPMRWSRTSGEGDGPAMSRMNFTVIECAPEMRRAVDRTELSRNLDAAQRIVDVRASVTLDFGTGRAWVMGVPGRVRRRPSTPQSLPRELPDLVAEAAHTDVGPADVGDSAAAPLTTPIKTITPTSTATSAVRGDEIVRDFGPAPTSECDFGSRAEVIMPPVAASELPKEVPFEIQLRNSSDHPIAVTKVSTSCGCVNARMDQTTIPAGASGVLRGTLLALKPIDKQERIDIVTAEQVTTVRLRLPIRMDRACVLATPRVALAAASISSVVFIARTEGSADPKEVPLPRLESDPKGDDGSGSPSSVSIGHAQPWTLLFRAADGSAAVWWTTIAVTRVRPAERVVVLKAVGPGLVGACQICPN